MLKFQRNYKIKFEIGEKGEDLKTLVPSEIIEIAYPFSLKNLKVVNGLNYSNVGQCSFQLLNLDEAVQKKLWKDSYDDKKYILMELCAGYGDNMPVIFLGFVNQCYSYRESGGVDYITDVQADNNSLINIFGFTNQTFAEGTKFEDIIKGILDDFPGYSIGYITPAIKPLARNQTFLGQTMDLLGRQYGDYDIFIDNNQFNILDKNEVVPGDLLVLSPESGLLGSPKRANLFLSCDLIFEPRIKLCQAIELQSESLVWFNGIYKVVSIEHQGMISPTECGTLTTRLTLSLGEDPFTQLQKATQSNYQNEPTSGIWSKPIQGIPRISAQFHEQRSDHLHQGIDIAANLNTPVYAPANGKIRVARWVNGYGKCIYIDNGKINNIQVSSRYGHLNEINVNEGQNVYKGQLIGLVGSTGRSDGPHLHFEVRQLQGNKEIAVNPFNYIGRY